MLIAVLGLEKIPASVKDTYFNHGASLRGSSSHIADFMVHRAERLHNDKPYMTGELAPLCPKRLEPMLARLFGVVRK